ncbi:MAG: hypothetical protein ACOC37_04750, partial [Spirochaetota bacterium]
DPATLGGELFDASQIVITAQADEAATRTVLSGITGVTRVEVLPSQESGTTELLIESEQELDLRREIFEAFSRKNVPLIGLRVKNATLEEIFLELTSGVKEAAS